MEEESPYICMHKAKFCEPIFFQLSWIYSLKHIYLEPPTPTEVELILRNDSGILVMWKVRTVYLSSFLHTIWTYNLFPFSQIRLHIVWLNLFKKMDPHHTFVFGYNISHYHAHEEYYMHACLSILCGICKWKSLKR